MGTLEIPSLKLICQIEIGKLLKDDRGIYPEGCAPLPTTVSNALFQSMRENDQLSCSAYRLLSHDRAALTYADLNRKKFDECAMATLGQHRLQFLSFCKAFKTDHQKIPFDLATFCKNPTHDSTHVLVHLNLAMNAKILNLDCLAKFTNLVFLSVSTCSSFTDQHFDKVCYSLKKLRHLDISETKVTNINPIAMLPQLQHFHMFRLNLKMSANDFCHTMVELKELRTLDLSNRRQDVQVNDYTSMQRDYARCLIDFCIVQQKTIFPHLCLLDVSGNVFVDDLGSDVAYRVIMQFVQHHPELRFLNVLDTALNRRTFMLTFPRINKLCVANGATRTQSIQALLIYAKSEREVFASHALQAIFYLLQTTYDHFTDDELTDTICGIEVAMRYNRKTLSIQMAGTACFYHICRLNRIKKLNAFYIRIILGRCLDASLNFKLIIQLQKNIWLTVCNDHLLQTLTDTHDMFRTCYVALEAMVASKDASIARMTIAIVSILAPKIPVARSQPLAREERYISYMIGVLHENLTLVDDRPATQNPEDHDDINVFTLKFTLSALWNLTDESPDACEIFVRLRGVEVVFQIIRKYCENANIITKVFGLLNNIAEVKRLRSYLITYDCVQTIVELFNTDMEKMKGQLNISYIYPTTRKWKMLKWKMSDKCKNNRHSRYNKFHDDGPWDFEPSRQECNRLLIDAVAQWPKSINTMVAYRSFQPFIPILTRYDLPGAQMWAVYAIYHVVCVDKQYEYISMLRKQGAFELFSEIAHGVHTHPSVREVAQSVLATFDS
ncbi:hypothetical protein QR680_000061 [Steinernema hermaphroditum]|uniref:Protein zer-1 homolog-like C-terminal domain-containing protein n=1 Tax=Steinernema hermaphroditum TaxID=289476 RepID=A0AA39GV54_9BILA|nr:hypothetical protein QR680_000061 [Steinernema hermaphroditum]